MYIMELLAPLINNNIINNIKNLKNAIFDKNISKFYEKKIGYCNIYHNNWDLSKNAIHLNEVNSIIDEINNHVGLVNKIDLKNVLYAGFIYSFPNCENQKFHYDYLCKTTSYFIPLTKLTNSNGTEYLTFFNKDDNDKNVNVLLNVNNEYTSYKDIDDYLLKNNIDKHSSYEYKIFNTDQFSLYKLPNNLFHRGKTNETNEVRIIFQIAVINNINETKYTKYILDDEIIKDAELDDSNLYKNI